MHDQRPTRPPGNPLAGGGKQADHTLSHRAEAEEPQADRFHPHLAPRPLTV